MKTNKTITQLLEESDTRFWSSLKMSKKNGSIQLTVEKSIIMDSKKVN